MGQRLFLAQGSVVALWQRPLVRLVVVLALIAVAVISIVMRDWWSLPGEMAFVAVVLLLLRREYRPEQ